MNQYGNYGMPPVYTVNPTYPQGQIPQQGGQFSNTQNPDAGVCNFINVNGVNQVLDYIVRPEGKAYFLDVNQPIMYTKTANSFGVTETKAYTVSEIPIESLMSRNDTATNTGDVVTREEYNALLERLNAIETQKADISVNNDRQNNHKNEQRRNRNESTRTDK